MSSAEKEFPKSMSSYNFRIYSHNRDLWEFPHFRNQNTTFLEK
ncbi:hypothetical protein LEP1GSC020_2653 [Leptospira interrogans serovar Grippotyphosa str. 2006006986]|nr:hypothetical protein LEP1GSC045_2642 [Leptospira interrogans serovar Pomona str. Kennewicki LC82-25]EKN96310.1 hypothetical protein LEP1GSC014_3137 [Leptospira interrogans serovar Pomona str. Pomona]EKO72039.1 hypothetical protein LEP1GSC069_0931 [Leptospira interrogans serovar Canicola str. Fiocruz LV133]EKO88943.1 hypothetical protein LEP1GSC009_3125 [Leptospira interrogans serovar Grippotyphosa str. Andaman]EKP86651.1 hypothetical protein LEP1GSC020_2653 [Leptospira interrogans serovar Gr